MLLLTEEPGAQETQTSCAQQEACLTSALEGHCPSQWAENHVGFGSEEDTTSNQQGLLLHKHP